MTWAYTASVQQCLEPLRGTLSQCAIAVSRCTTMMSKLCRRALASYTVAVLVTSTDCMPQQCRGRRCIVHHHGCCEHSPQNKQSYGNWVIQSLVVTKGLR